MNKELTKAEKRHEIFSRLKEHTARTSPQLSIIETVKLLSLQCPHDSDDELLAELQKVS